MGYEKIVVKLRPDHSAGRNRPMVGLLGSQAVVGALDVRVGADGSSVQPSAAVANVVQLDAEWIEWVTSLGVGEILVTAWSRGQSGWISMN